ncbi:MAG: dTDP-4-dehydrorhamnose 3,5-epimerase [Desulfococcus multivorans]|jgi:dTDP-4-dehydrorhamnose 3,5-epimerase|uniref:dTDP-4-dehydrorhamnose 3,5-epimerase n=1 Tax=Desulfococcus sp. TaxID=2025834 RepID=UPI002A48B936|nr:dTDP-4-dehydrorhamnose 3,5-epimerase [Desulfococcus multivorans]
MIFDALPIEGAYAVRLEKREDERGFFARAWCQREFAAHGLAATVVQTNIAGTRRKGTLRGMHYQLASHAEAKLFRCNRGAIYDVMIDLRPDSSTFESWYGITLNARDDRMVYVPEGCAHGYMALADDTEVMYLVSEFYNPDAERGVRWNDPFFAVSWPAVENVIVSDKDGSWPDYAGRGNLPDEEGDR